MIFSNNVQNTHSNNSNNISNNNYHYYAYSKQPINSAQNNILNNNFTLNLKDSTGITTASYVPSYTNGAVTPSHQSAKSFAVSSAALTANKSKFKHRMSASSVAASIPYNTSSTPIVTNSNDNSICDNNQTYNFDSPNLNSLKSSSSASLTLYTYLLQTNKNIGRDVKSSVIRSQTKKLTRNSPGPGKELINFISNQSWLIFNNLNFSTVIFWLFQQLNTVKIET